MHRYALAVSLVLAASAALAQTPGDCAVGQASGTLDVSDVAATFFTTGTIAYGPGEAANYFVPKSTRLSPLYAANVWVGGTVGGEFRVAGATYGQGGLNNDNFELWPGPLNDDGTLPNAADCSAYDRVWVVSVLDVLDYEQTGTATANLADWPVGLGAPAVDADGDEIVPTSRDQTLDLAAGERPVIAGSQTAFWVMNDVGDEHRATGSVPLGVEVAVTAFSIASETPALNQATFLRYAITNRNAQPIEDARVSLWADPDLGYAGDDFIGVDTTRSMAFVYNADEVDEGNYGDPPAFGVDVLGGLASDERQDDLTSFVYFTGGDANRGDPSTAEEYDRIMRGVWADGTPLTDFGNGYAQGGEPTTFAFPGDPVTGAFWSEENTGNGRSVADDRRFVLSTGPGTLAPGETRTVDVGLLFAFGADRLDSVTELRAASDLVQAAYDAGSLFETSPVPDGPPPAAPPLLSPEDGAGPLEGSVELVWSAVPDATEYLVEVSGDESFENARISIAVDTTSVILPRGESGTVYWRVRAKRGLFVGSYSEVRRFTYRAALGPVLGIVEVVGPGGAEPCAETAQSTAGCPVLGRLASPEAPGNNVYQSLNSTGEYILSFRTAGSLESVGNFAPNDYEVRFVPLEEGAYAEYGFTSGRFIQVPFEVWDIGIVPPGTENDPSDDVQLVPVVFSDEGDDAAAECEFKFGGPTILGLGMTTQRIYAYYPVDDDYEAFEAAAAPVVAAAGGCADYHEAVDAFIDFGRGRPLQRDVLEDATGARTGPLASDFSYLEGTVIRYYTNDDVGTPSEAEAPASQTATLGASFPNPVRRWAAVPYEVAAPGPVRLAVYDVLGREVAVLVEGDRPAGPAEARLDASALAAGVYVVVLQTPGGRATRTLTVAR